MKVLITHELFMPDFAGGGEKLAFEMAKNLQKKGIEVKILTTGNPKIKQYKGIETIRLPINRYLLNFALLPILKHAKDVDLIQTCNYNACFPSWLAGKILKKPVVCLTFGLYGKGWIKMRGIIKGFFSMFIEKIQLNRSYDKTIFLSNYSKENGKKIGIREINSKVINPGIELENFKPEKKKKIVLFSGRFAKQKGVYNIIKVAEKLPDVKFVMMGWGEEETKLKKIAPSNVEFSSLTSKSGKPYFDMYGKSSIFLFPSIGETFGFVLVEAMASGCAIVSTIPLKFKGFVVNPENIDDTTKKIKYLIDNPKIAEKYGKENVKLSKKYTWESFTSKLIATYKECLKKRI